MCCCNLVIGGTLVSLRKLVLGMAKKVTTVMYGTGFGFWAEETTDEA